VPNQNSRFKFLIREEFRVKFPERGEEAEKGG
jgi:hypothetical protein